MVRTRVMIAVVVLLLGAQVLLAQRGGGRSGGRGGAGGRAGNPSAPSETEEMKDFERGFALQATPEQVSQFQVLSKNTEAARKQAHDFLHMIETGAQPPEFSDPVDDLKDAVQEAHDGSKEFAQKLSQLQKSSFKALTKKLAKANADVAKQGQAFDQEAGRAKADHQGMATVLKQLEEALANLRAEQLDIGKAMGIQMQ